MRHISIRSFTRHQLPTKPIIHEKILLPNLKSILQILGKFLLMWYCHIKSLFANLVILVFNRIYKKFLVFPLDILWPYCLRHFKFFSATGGGGGLFGQHSRKHSWDSLIDLKFGAANYRHKTMKSTKP